MTASVSNTAGTLLGQTLSRLANGMSVPGMAPGAVLDAPVGISSSGPSDAYSPSDGPAATYTPATPAVDPGTYTDQGLLTSSSDSSD